MFLLTYSCLLILACQNTAETREEINFDFGWRFHAGELLPCKTEAFDKRNLTNVHCKGLAPNSAVNSSQCLEACCANPSCTTWQFSEDAGCWVGNSDDCKTKDSSWVGSARDLPKPSPTPAATGPTSRSYDDSSWEVVDVPHDGIITEKYVNDFTLSLRGYLPRTSTMYRKHFNLPLDWKGLSIWVYFEGVFRASTVYLNGEMLIYHDCGYTSFVVPISSASNVFYGDGKDNENMIVVRAIQAGESGWWYESCGIYRHVKLVTSNPVHLLPNSVYGASNVTSQILYHDINQTDRGMFAEKTNFYFRADAMNNQDAEVDVSVRFALCDENGMMVKAVSTDPINIGVKKNATVTATFYIEQAEIWSNRRPYLYTLQTELLSNSKVLDTVNVTIGVRQTHWDSKTGFYLNNMPFIWRGFNNHNSLAGVGMAIPDRVNLFRAQSARAVGANAWRMSHDPPIPILLDILDRLGFVVWDENREFGENDIWVGNQKDMVKRDRNHPSVMVWSFCNERHCNLSGNADLESKVAKEFRKVSYEEDTFRPVSANVNPKSGQGLTPVLDIQGLSHRNGSVFDQYHMQYPNKPLIGSECCSCRNQRGEPVTNKTQKIYSSFNADCYRGQIQAELNRSFVAGVMIWTLFDYYGEPTPYLWPHVSSSFGSIDLAGFAKASAYWYRAWWLYDITNQKRKDVTFNAPSLVDPGAQASEENTKDGYMIHILQDWESVPGYDSKRTIQVYTNGKYVELFVNGKSQGTKEIGWLGWAEWNELKYSPGTLTANVLTTSGNNKKILATHVRGTAGEPVRIVAGVDVPSAHTGTGAALVLDGQDTGMVHAAILNSKGHVVSGASHNVTFRVVSGPGRIVAVGNGNPACHEPNHATWRSAYHGLVRAFVQVTKDQSSSAMHRKRLLQIDGDGGMRTVIVPPGFETPLEDIVIEASVDKLGSSKVTIPVSSDSGEDGVLKVAEQWYKN